MRMISLMLALLGILIGVFGLFGEAPSVEICGGSILLIAIALLMWAVWGRDRAR